MVDLDEDLDELELMGSNTDTDEEEGEHLIDVSCHFFFFLHLFSIHACMSFQV